MSSALSLIFGQIQIFFCEQFYSPGKLRFECIGVTPVEIVGARGLEKRLDGRAGMEFFPLWLPPDRLEVRKAPPLLQRGSPDPEHSHPESEGIAHRELTEGVRDNCM